MDYNAEIVERILQEYEDTRIANETARQNRVREVYTKIPRIAQIDNEIASVGANIFTDPTNAKQYLAHMKQTFARLNAEKAALLRENGFDADCMKTKYMCGVCRDTGYVGNTRCKCFEQKLINAAYVNSNLMDLMKNQNFAFFSFDYYSDKIVEPDGVSPLSRIKDIYNIAKAFSENFDSYPKSLLFYGSSGLGKTFLSGCIAKEVLDSGKTVIYMDAAGLFEVYEEARYNKRNAEGMIERFYNSDLLIIDDLGTEYRARTNLVESSLFALLNRRMRAGKKMIISTNFNMNELTKMYTTRFTSRIYEFFTPLKFLGDDIRVKKLNNGI